MVTDVCAATAETFDHFAAESEGEGRGGAGGGTGGWGAGCVVAHWGSRGGDFTEGDGRGRDCGAEKDVARVAVEDCFR